MCGCGKNKVVVSPAQVSSNVTTVSAGVPAAERQSGQSTSPSTTESQTTR